MSNELWVWAVPVLIVVFLFCAALFNAVEDKK
jgi:hypothetical protein